MLLRRTTVSLCALVAALPAFAQDIDLEDINVSGANTEGFFGETISLQTGTVAKTGDAIAETPRSVSVITADQIQERGARDLEEVLAYTPGVRAGAFGMDNRADWSYVRGFNPSFLRDGLPTRYGFYNSPRPETFLLNSVEVLRGPASGLYGDSSVGGVINTTSKTSAQDAPNIVQAQIGTNKRKQVAVDFSGDGNEDGTLKYRFVGLLRDSDDVLAYSQDDAIAIAPSLTWKLGADTEVTILAEYQKNNATPASQFASYIGTLQPVPDQFVIPGFGAVPSPHAGRQFDSDLYVGEPGFDRYDARSGSISANFQHRFNEVWSLNANARYSDSKGDYDHAYWYGATDLIAAGNIPAVAQYLYLGRYNADGTINRTFYKSRNTLKTAAADAYATAEYRLGGVEMRSIVGFNYNRAKFDKDSSANTDPANHGAPINPFDPNYGTIINPTIIDTPAVKVTEWGVYNQNRATIEDRLFLDFGLRFSQIERGESTDPNNNSVDPAAKDSDWTGNAAIMYVLDNGLAPYASWATSFQQETLGAQADGTAFEPTKGRQYEIGVKYQPKGTNTLLSAAAFDITKSNLLQTDPNDPSQRIQTGEASSKGIELEAFHNFGEVSVQASYTLLDTETETQDYIDLVPEQMASAWINYAPKSLDGWNFGLGARFTGKTKGSAGFAVPGLPTEFETESYTLLDAAISYQKNDWRVALNVSNLTDKRVITGCATFTCYFGEGRNVQLSVTKAF
ncbi:TonB-dependent siderophore receptor [Shimia marina]|uniref:Ferric hydroxamate uptake n=1 Tax=Shimia marina TaxID=321267 RepID=A0A0N7LRH9_9RHOB|nr:TonB-dependent siderophore receptor [Shimia marina]CUH50868.1 Ferric hydroxamate uptake [Shimia marina]SFE55333.1 iron complex outermembrane recepter protein [Shimia marina]